MGQEVDVKNRVENTIKLTIGRGNYKTVGRSVLFCEEDTLKLK